MFGVLDVGFPEPQRESRTTGSSCSCFKDLGPAAGNGTYWEPQTGNPENIVGMYLPGSLYHIPTTFLGFPIWGSHWNLFSSVCMGVDVLGLGIGIRAQGARRVLGVVCRAWF